MFYLIKDKSGAYLGTIEFVDNKPQLKGVDFNAKFKEFLDQISKEGIPIIRGIYDPEGKNCTLAQKITPINQTSPLDLRKFLENSGFTVIEKYPEIEEEIKNLLKDFPDDNPDKIAILSKLPDMSHLEQTLLLRELKKLN